MSGYTHTNANGDIVFRVSDDGSTEFGAGIDPLRVSISGINKGDTFWFQTSTGAITLIPGTFTYNNGKLAVNTASIGSNIFKVSGQTQLDLGSDAPGDLLVRGSSGHLVRLPVGSPSEGLGAVSGTPA